MLHLNTFLLTFQEPPPLCLGLYIMCTCMCACVCLHLWVWVRAFLCMHVSVCLGEGVSHCRHVDTGVPVCSLTEIPAPGNEACCICLLPQAHNCTRKDFERMYPAFPKFCAIREKLDPTGMFLNAYLEKVFY